MQKNEIRTFSPTTYKNKLKMDYRPKCKTVNYKNLRGKHRQISDINHKKILYDPPPRVMEIKAKINKWDLINLKTFAQ